MTNTILMDTIDLSVFNEQGELVTKIETAGGAVLKYSDDMWVSSYLGIRDVLVNLKMLEAISHKEEKQTSSDFEQALQNNDNETVLKFKHRKENEKKPTFKLIGEGVLYSPETRATSHDFKIVIPKATFSGGFDIDMQAGDSFTPDYVFHIESYNNENDLFDLRLKERK